MKSLKLELPELEHLVRGVETEQIHRWFSFVATDYIKYGLALPPENAWRLGKLADSANAGQQADALGLKLGFSNELLSVVCFMAFSADVGRLIIACEHQNGKVTRQKIDHGAASADLILEAGDLTEVSESLKATVCTAVLYHSIKKTPSLQDIGGRATWVLCCLLRDLDKSSIVVNKSHAYCWDNTERNRQLVANNLTESAEVTSEILDAFERGDMITRSDCRTYADWLLQFLAWAHDFNYQEMWNLARPGYKPVFEWLRTNVDADTYARILKASKAMGHDCG